MFNDALQPPVEQRPTKGGGPQNDYPQAELPLSKKCLGCLCEANTNCDLSIKCVLNQFCGPYLISQTYWADGGRIGNDYRRCAFNKTCSEETVQAYMAKNAIDCNGDGYIDCDVR